MIDRKIRAEVASYSRLLHEMRFVANHDGNISVRAPGSPKKFFCTPTAVSKRLIQEDDIISVNEQGKKISGKGRPFSEIGLHLAAYAAREEVGAVVHAHPPYATAFGVSGEKFSPAFLPEAVVSLGTEVPTVPCALPGEKAVAALRPFLATADAFLLAGNGVLAVGADLEQAYLRLELVEHLCRIAHLAAPLGGPKMLPAEFLGPLLEARKKAGLGPKNAPTTPPPPPPVSSVIPSPAPDIRRLVTEEIVRALREK